MLPFDFWWTLLTIVLVIGAILGTVAYAVLAERKVSAYMQDRIGPNRVGPFGLLQPIVDGIKLFLKEEVTPAHVDKLFFIAAPGVACATALFAFTVVPFGPTTPIPPPVPVAASTPSPEELQQYKDQMTAYQKGDHNVIAPGVDIGILLGFAVGSLAVYGIILGGWSANNKYSLLGSLRSSAQIISYEIPLGMSVLGVVLYAGSLNLETIIHQQTQMGWNILFQPLAFLLFMTAVFAECNRLPFDLPEAEQELVGGYHTEYSSMKLSLFLLGEYVHMITTSFLMAVVFLGGWHFPGLSGFEGTFGVLLKFAVLLTKVLGFLLLYLLVRWTIPRFRFDQLMSLAWQVLIPLALLNLFCVMVVREFDLSPWMLLLTSVALMVGAGLISTRGPNNAPRRFAPLPLDPKTLAARV